MKEICLCAAIKLTNGRVYPGRRHGHCLYSGQLDYPKDWKTVMQNEEQGFLTNFNRFVSREEGRKLQDAAGIPSADKEGYRGNTLFSEDLY